MQIDRNETRLIVCADDFGYSPGVNKGIIETLTKGIVTSAGVMVDSKYLNEITGFYKKNPRADLGLHLVFHKDKQDKLFVSFQEQLEKYLKVFKSKPSHLSFHASSQDKKLIDNKKKKIAFCLKLLSRKHKLYLRGEGVNNRIAFQASESLEVTRDKFLKILSKLERGLNQIIVHPGVKSDSILDSSYYSSLLRDNERKVLTNKKIICSLKSKQVKLCGYNILKKKTKEVKVNGPKEG